MAEVLIIYFKNLKLYNSALCGSFRHYATHIYSNEFHFFLFDETNLQTIFESTKENPIYFTNSIGLLGYVKFFLFKLKKRPD